MNDDYKTTCFMIIYPVSSWPFLEKSFVKLRLVYANSSPDRLHAYKTRRTIPKRLKEPDGPGDKNKLSKKKSLPLKLQ